MPGTRFERPASLGEALSLMGEGSWTPIAGGTDLMVRMRDGSVRPEGLLDITGLDEMRGIRIDGDTLVIGALASHADLETSDLVNRHAFALARAASMIGSPQIRNRGTVGGNLLNASPAADTVPPFFVMGARVSLVGPGGGRTVSVEEFFLGPGKTVRADDELLTDVRIKVPPEGHRSRFSRLGTRKALAIAKLSVAVGAASGEDGLLRGVRVALGAVAPTVIRASAAEAAIEGRVPSPEAVDAAVSAVKDDARPISDIRSTAGYRKEMCGVLLGRILASWSEAG